MDIFTLIVAYTLYTGESAFLAIDVGSHQQCVDAAAATEIEISADANVDPYSVIVECHPTDNVNIRMEIEVDGDESA